MVLTPIGTIRTRYPGNDPENGSAYPQRWNGVEWVCASHRFRAYEADPLVDDYDYQCKQCTRCQQPWGRG